MDELFTMKALDEPDWGVIGGGISAFNKQQAGDDHGKYLCYVLEAPDGKHVGGVIGVTYWNWLFVELMWLDESLRGQGYGSQLLTAAEDEARLRGAEYSYLDTFSFQAPEFYKKHGYEVFGTLEDFPPGHRRYFMTKRLIP